jgi:outer membrane protein assembly factor BamB
MNPFNRFMFANRVTRQSNVNKKYLYATGKESLYGLLAFSGEKFLLANVKTFSFFALIVLSLSVISLSLLPAQVVKADWVSTYPWPGPGQNLNNTSYQPNGIAPTSNATLWMATLNLNPDGSPSIADGRVFIGTNGASPNIAWVMFCFNETTGEQIWYFGPGTSGGCPCGVAVADGRVFFGSWDGKIYCLNETNGAQIWNYTAKGDTYALQVAYGRVYFGSADKALYCVNASNGQFIWNYTTGGSVTSTPAVVDGKVYIGSDKLYCLNATAPPGNYTGSDPAVHLWNYSTGRSVKSPAVAYNKVFFSSGSEVYCLTIGGTFVWNCILGGGGYDVSVAYHYVYVGCWDNKTYCIDEPSGSLVWTYETGNHILSKPAIADSKVFIGSNDGNLYCLKAVTSGGNYTGTDPDIFIWRYSTGNLIRGSPAVADNHVFVVSNNAKLYCFGTDQGPPPFIPEFPAGLLLAAAVPAVLIFALTLKRKTGKTITPK